MLESSLFKDYLDTFFSVPLDQQYENFNFVCENPKNPKSPARNINNSKISHQKLKSKNVKIQSGITTDCESDMNSSKGTITSKRSVFKTNYFEGADCRLKISNSMRKGWQENVQLMRIRLAQDILTKLEKIKASQSQKPKKKKNKRTYKPQYDECIAKFSKLYLKCGN